MIPATQVSDMFVDKSLNFILKTQQRRNTAMWIKAFTMSLLILPIFLLGVGCTAHYSERHYPEHQHSQGSYYTDDGHYHGKHDKHKKHHKGHGKHHGEYRHGYSSQNTQVEIKGH